MTSSKRQTVPVADVITWANARIAVDGQFAALDGLTPDQAFRRGVASLLEQILHRTGNYAGFGYPASELAAPGELRDGYDDTRRIYYGGRA